MCDPSLTIIDMNQGEQMASAGAALIIISLVIYTTNFIKCVTAFIGDDYKISLVHAIGIFVPPTSFITVWF